MTAYYSENDPYAAEWLRVLILEGLIAPGYVDERSIEDVTPNDLRGFTQCHFFAGIGGWSHALRLAGVSDDRELWTGSCPCQPFSQATQGKGFADERHLWPAWFHLIDVCRPPVIFGEQSASKAALAWLDLVSADLEAAGYALGAGDIPAAGVGAPHIRQRLYWVADSLPAGRAEGWSSPRDRPIARSGGVDRLADRSGSRLEVERLEQARRQRAAVERGGTACQLGYTGGERQQLDAQCDSAAERGESGQASCGADANRSGFWAGCDWIPCRDGKSRPVEPGSFPLAHGVPGRVGLLRGYGNAICAPLAAAFIEAYDEIA